MNTIVAISTPFGNGGISIIRISGGQAMEIANALFQPLSIKYFNLAEPYKLYLGTFNAKTFKDKCMAVFFKAPKSYTGEDLVEFHCHGGYRLTVAVLNEIIKNGAVLADKGEFTKRAYLNDKLTLDKAEGILEMINAESLSKINAGFRLEQGLLKQKIDYIKEKILYIIASIEVGLDNPFEFDDKNLTIAKNKLYEINDIFSNLLKNSNLTAFVEAGVKIAIIGQTNRGKSSLLNLITKSQKAIVTDIAGTTRDVIEQSVEFNGMKLIFSDTAGIRDTENTIEKIGIEKSNQVAMGSDVIIILLDAFNGIEEYDKILIEKFKDKKMLFVYNKSDLLTKENIELLERNIEKEFTKDGISRVIISVKENKNVDILLNKIFELLNINEMDLSSEILLNNRHIEALNKAQNYILDIINKFQSYSLDCLIVDLNEIVSTLGEIDGSHVSTEVVNTVFSKFCVGK